MAVPLTNLDKFRVFFQITNNICQLQANIRSNVTTWKAMAQAQSPALGTLQNFMHDGANAWLTRLGWVDTLRANPTKRQHIIDVLNDLGINEADIVDKVTAMQSVATQLSGAPLASYAACITACDGILAAVDVAFSLWPE